MALASLAVLAAGAAATVVLWPAGDDESFTPGITSPRWDEQQGFEENEVAIAGAELFAESGCLNCHTYLGDGSGNLGAPDLSSIGRNGWSAARFARYVGDPSDFGNDVMPRYGAASGGGLTDRQLRTLGVFLAASREAPG